jgi:hypothetical protein
MIRVVDEIHEATTEIQDLPFNPRMLDRQSLLLANMAMKLAKKNPLGPNQDIGLYCILEIPNHDADVASILSKSTSSLMQTFGREIRPTRVLQQMPIAQAFWSALAIRSEGPLRIFYQSPSAKEIATQQAQLDLKDRICETALVLSVQLQPEQVWGLLLRAEV